MSVAIGDRASANIAVPPLPARVEFLVTVAAFKKKARSGANRTLTGYGLLQTNSLVSICAARDRLSASEGASRAADTASIRISDRIDNVRTDEACLIELLNPA